MIGREAARAAAAAAFAGLRAGDGGSSSAGFIPWPEASPGTPVAVEDMEGAASYWLVPLEAQGRTVGAVRVDAAGRVMTIGPTCRPPGRIEGCPKVVTLLDAGEAERMARAALEPGEAAAPPRFVHDGPPGREGWLVATRRGGRPARWLLVTPGGVAARPAGVRMGDDPGLE